jgi:hypothetical protein
VVLVLVVVMLLFCAISNIYPLVAPEIIEMQGAKKASDIWYDFYPCLIVLF